LLDAYPKGLTKEGLEENTSYSASSSSMHNALSELRKASLIDGGRGSEINASQWLAEG
jgi:hypothetical protein